MAALLAPLFVLGGATYVSHRTSLRAQSEQLRERRAREIESQRTPIPPRQVKDFLLTTDWARGQYRQQSQSRYYAGEPMYKLVDAVTGVTMYQQGIRGGGQGEGI